MDTQQSPPSDPMTCEPPADARRVLVTAALYMGLSPSRVTVTSSSHTADCVIHGNPTVPTAARAIVREQGQVAGATVTRMKTGLRCVVRPVLLRMFRVRVTYKATTTTLLNSGRACILVCNHVSLLDGIIVALASPIPLAFAVDTEYSRGAGAATRFLQTLAWLGFGKIVPIDSAAPFGIRSLLTELQRGGRVLVFPEGRISETGQRGVDQPGVIWLADRSAAPIAELEIRGAEQSRFFAKSGSATWPRIKLLF